MKQYEQISNGKNTNGTWETLKEMPFKTGGGYKTESGIILTGDAAREQQMKDLGYERVISRPKESIADAPMAQLGESERNESPVQTEDYHEEPLAQSEELDYSEPVEQIDEIQESIGSVEGNAETETPAEDHKETAEEIEEDSQDQNEEEKPIGEEESSYDEIAFLQSTELADKLKKDSNYLTVLTSSGDGFAVEKARAVDACIDKMKNAEDNKQIWQAIRLGQEIVASKNYSDEEKQRVKEFMITPVARMKELSFRIASEEKALKRDNEGIRRWEQKYNELNTGNVVSKFLRRHEIEKARNGLVEFRKRRDNTEKYIEQRREELRKIENSMDQAA